MKTEGMDMEYQEEEQTEQVGTTDRVRKPSRYADPFNFPKKPWTIEHLETTQPGRVRAARSGSRASAMALMCQDCVNCQRSEIKDCDAKWCPMWPYKDGKFNPNHGLPVPEKDKVKAETMRQRMAERNRDS